MKNSDLFLELLDDDLLKPETNLNTSINDEKVEDKTSADLSKPSSSGVRYDFDICSALDKVKEEQLKKIELSKNQKSLIHTGDTDSSDDEDNKYLDSCNYNDFGRDIKRIMVSNSPIKSNTKERDDIDDDVSSKWTDSTAKKKSERPVKQMSLPDKPVVKGCDPYADPYFGIRIVNPLISSQGIQIRMSGKTPVTLPRLQSHLAKKVDTDFVVAGVIVRSVTKQSQNDSQYLIWEISDLRDDLLCVSIFLFGQCYKDLWKTQIGTVIALLNPTSGNKKGSSGNESFNISVKFSDQVMIWGHSKDYGLCKSLKKNGEKCSSFVNKSHCEFCVYHVKKEYSKFSLTRSEIQSPSGGRNINFLRNKVLGKNEVFYGGKSYTSLNAPCEKAKEKAKKLNPKDQQRLTNLGVTVLENKVERKSHSVSLPHAPRAAQALRTLNMDSQVLRSLSLPTSNKPDSIINSKTALTQNNKTSVISKTDKSIPKLSDPDLDFTKKIPNLSRPDCDVSTKPSNLDSLKSGSKFNSLKDVKSIVPSLSNPEKHNLKFENVENVVSGRSKMLFEEAISKMDSPRSKERKKSSKPSLSNPEFDDSPKSSKKSKSSRLKKNISKNELPSPSSSNSKKSKVPTLSNPAEDICKNDQKPINKSSKDLQMRFKSLFEVASGGSKAKTVFSEINNLKFSPAYDAKQTDVQSDENSVVNSKTDKLNENTDRLDNTSCSKSVSKTEGGANDSVASLQTASGVSAKYDIPCGYSSPSNKKMSKAKARAIMFVKSNGPLTKTDPNSVKKTPESNSKKRDRCEEEGGSSGQNVGGVVFSELYMQLMKQTSQEQDLVEAEKLRVEEEYFEKMGLKEQLEEKMLNTFKIDCKAVKCLQCKYVWFSAADKCKMERHTLKIIDTVKRFFKCGNCGNRTVSLHIVPMFSCKNCSSSNWQRAPMMREKIVKVNNQLSIRGGEQQFINSQICNSNLNLLVPE